MTFAVRELAGATGRCDSAQAANQIAGGFVRKLPKVPTTADFNRPTFPDRRHAPKSWAGNQFLLTFQRTAMVWKSGTIGIWKAHPGDILPDVVVGCGVSPTVRFRPALTSKSGL